MAEYSEADIVQDHDDSGQRVSRSVSLFFTKLAWALFSMRGRLSRKQFFGYCLITYGLPLCAYFAVASLSASGFLSIASSTTSTSYEDGGVFPIVALVCAVILLVWISWALTLKRAHDFGQGWGTVLLLNILAKIPYVGILTILVYFCVPGEPTSNIYGAAAGWDHRPK